MGNYARCLCQSCKVFCKLIQLALVVLCIALHCFSYYGQNDETVLLISCTYGIFFVIILGDIAATCVSKRTPKMMEILYRLCGVFLFFACGFQTVQYFSSDFNHLKLYFTSNMDPEHVVAIGMLKGVVSFVTSASFLISFISSCVSSDRDPAVTILDQASPSYNMLTV